MLNFHWLLESESVTDERSGSLDAGTLGYSSSGRGYWPLTLAGSRSGMLNSYWHSTHPGSLGRLNGALNSDWLSGGSFFPPSPGLLGMWRGERSSWRCTNNGRGRGITKVHRGITKVHRGITKVHSGAARCRRPQDREPNSCGFHTGVGLQWGVWETSFSPDGSGNNSPNW